MIEWLTESSILMPPPSLVERFEEPIGSIGSETDAGAPSRLNFP